ncbi:hypothetical protein MLD38_019864 [Melastoma candidum]|uniref:Uncharacterized protein n=1 Tax=Melastoma candidum TaxID=119954 RepID=A0ACB9QBG6_9MYRT|nr:hypothetical protein MLD38_019864 [Melastoma candidum]
MFSSIQLKVSMKLVLSRLPLQASPTPTVTRDDYATRVDPNFLRDSPIAPSCPQNKAQFNRTGRQKELCVKTTRKDLVGRASSTSTGSFEGARPWMLEIQEEAPLDYPEQ